MEMWGTWHCQLLFLKVLTEKKWGQNNMQLDTVITVLHADFPESGVI